MSTLPPPNTRIGIALRDLDAKPIDSGFYQITEGCAKKLNGGRLPKSGYEALVVQGDLHFWLARTPRSGKVVWSVRFARGWKFDGPLARTSSDVELTTEHAWGKLDNKK